MNLLCCAAFDPFWLNVFKELEIGRGIRPVYWIGSGAFSSGPEQCFYHDAWEAFALEGCIPGWEREAESFDVNVFGRKEYYNYLKILDRVDFSGKFSFSERDDLFKRQVSYWFFVLKSLDVDLVFFSNAPHLPFDYPLYVCAKALGVKTLMFNSAALRGWHYITEEIGGRALEKSSENFDEYAFRKLSQDSIGDYLFSKHQEPWYMKAQSDSQRSLRVKIPTFPYVGFIYIFFRCLRDWVVRRRNYRTVFTWGRKYGSIKFYDGCYVKKDLNIFEYHRIVVDAERKRLRLKKEYQRYSKCFDPATIGPYVYFAMHYQPELTTTPLGDDASDQFYVIRELARSLPKGYKVVVKEHPSQFSRTLFGEQGRSLGCWDLLQNFNNVILADLSISSIALVQNASAVVTVTGTVGWEAMVNGKPCLHFGGAWYQNFPQSTKVDFSNLKAKLRSVLNAPFCRKVTYNDVVEYFAEKAIKMDIHGELKGGLPRNPALTAQYILRLLD